MKKTPSKVAHNRPNFFFQYCQPTQNQPKSQFLFHKSCSLRNLCIMILFVEWGLHLFLLIEKLNCTSCFFPISFIDIGCVALRLYETFDLKKYQIVKPKYSSKVNMSEKQGLSSNNPALVKQKCIRYIYILNLAMFDRILLIVMVLPYFISALYYFCCLIQGVAQKLRGQNKVGP